MSTAYQIDQVYSFNVFPVALLGNNFQNVTVQALLDANTAQILGVDIQAIHRQIYPLLPPGTPSDPTKYTYLKVRLQSGAVSILAVPWIDDTTVSLVSSATIVVTIGNVSSLDQARIQACLVQNGYGNLSFELT